MTRAPRTVADELARLIRGELEIREFPWLDPEQRRALGSMGMSMLEAGRAKEARAAFAVLVDLEPENALNHLMLGHAAGLEDDVPSAFEAFGQAIHLSAAESRQRSVASEAFLARGDLLLRLGRLVEARADLADAATRMTDPVRRRSIETFLAS